MLIVLFNKNFLSVSTDLFYSDISYDLVFSEFVPS